MLTICTLTLLYFTFFKYRHIKVVKATAKKFIRHAHSDDQTINYRIEFIVNRSSDDMKIDELWIDRKLYKFRITRITSKELISSFDEKESLKIDAHEIVDDVETSALRPPHRLSGAAIIGYWIGDKKRYLSVNKIEFLPA